MTPAAEAKRKRWMTAYEAALTAAVPALAGKVDWIAASYYFNEGQDALEAAAKVAKRWSDHDSDLPDLGLPDLELPQASINGTSIDALVEQQAAIVIALAQVGRRMAEAMPHGRDYQYRPAEFPKAQAAWRARVLLIHHLMEEIAAHGTAIRRLEG